MPIGVVLTITAKPGTSAAMRTHLEQAVADSRTEPGNLVCVLMADPDDDHRFTMFEIYRDEAAITAHQQADYVAKSTPVIHGLFAAPIEVKRYATLDWPATMRMAYDPQVLR